MSDRGVRRVLAWGLGAGLTVAAVAAIVALLTGDLDETDGNVVATGLGFVLASGLGVAGATARLEGGAWTRAVGAATIAVSLAAFLLFAMTIWTGGDGDDLWRWTGAGVLLAAFGAHVCVMQAARRHDDPGTIATLVGVAAGVSGIATLFGVIALAGGVDELDEEVTRLMAVLLVVGVLATVLQPLVRHAGERTHRRHDDDALDQLSTAALAVADRLEAGEDPAGEAARLRSAVRRARRRP